MHKNETLKHKKVRFYVIDFVGDLFFIDSLKAYKIPRNTIYLHSK